MANDEKKEVKEIKALTPDEKRFIEQSLDSIKDLNSVLKYKKLKLQDIEYQKQEFKKEKTLKKSVNADESDKKYRHGVFVVLGILWRMNLTQVASTVGKFLAENNKLSEYDAMCVETFFKAKKQDFKIEDKNILKKGDKKDGFKEKVKVANEKKLKADIESNYWTLCEKIKTTTDPLIIDALKLEIKLGKKTGIFELLQKKETKKKPVEKK